MLSGFGALLPKLYPSLHFSLTGGDRERGREEENKFNIKYKQQGIKYMFAKKKLNNKRGEAGEKQSRLPLCCYICIHNPNVPDPGPDGIHLRT